MNIVVNYLVKEGQVKIIKNNIGGENTILFNPEIGVGVVDYTLLDSEKPLTALQFSEIPLPLIVTLEYAQKVIGDTNKKKAELKNNESGLEFEGGEVKDLEKAGE